MPIDSGMLHAFGFRGSGPREPTPAQQRHSERFGKVSDRYARRVAEAYGRDLARAMTGSDEQVAAKVAAWEKCWGRDAVASDQAIREWLACGVGEGRGKEAP
jgi:hypothetical protein